MPIEPPDPLRTVNALVNVLADLRRLAQHHPVLWDELRRAAADRPEAEVLVIVLDAVAHRGGPSPQR